MNSRNELFKLITIAARLQAETTSRYSVDRGTLVAYGINEEAVNGFIRTMRGLVETPEYRKYLEGVFLEFAQSIFALTDGICSYAADSPHSFKIVDETNLPLGDDLHFDFGVYLREHPSP